jgi:hypothetical protein
VRAFSHECCGLFSTNLAGLGRRWGWTAIFYRKMRSVFAPASPLPTYSSGAYDSRTRKLLFMNHMNEDIAEWKLGEAIHYESNSSLSLRLQGKTGHIA